MEEASTVPNVAVRSLNDTVDTHSTWYRRSAGFSAA